MTDLQHNARLEAAIGVLDAIKTVTSLTAILDTCTTDEERANVQRLIDEATEEARKRGDRLLQITGSPTIVGNA